MDIYEIMKARHSVRQYLDRPIPDELRTAMDSYTAELNAEGGLHMQILYDEPECFASRKAHYGGFRNVNNYISVVGPKGAGLDETAGFYGELLVLKAQELGLNTCWVALTHGKSKAAVGADEKEAIVISLGFGETQGKQRKSKSAGQVSDITPDSPEWYKKGIEAALLAPTAINQQRFKFSRDGNTVFAKAATLGPCLKIDLGIAKAHFELIAGKENFTWG